MADDPRPSAAVETSHKRSPSEDSEAYRSAEGSDSDDEVPDLLGRRRRTASDEEEDPEGDDRGEYEYDEASDAGRRDDENDSEGEYRESAPPDADSSDLEEGEGGKEHSKPPEVDEEGEGKPESETKAEVQKVEPFVVPTSGAFYMHDDRFSEDVSNKNRGRGGRKLWQGKEEKKWSHDMFENLNAVDNSSYSYRGRGNRYQNEEYEFENYRGRGRRGSFRGRGRAMRRGGGRGRGERWEVKGKYETSDEIVSNRAETVTENTDYGQNASKGEETEKETSRGLGKPVPNFNADAQPFHPNSSNPNSTQHGEVSDENRTRPQSIEEFDKALRNGEFADYGDERGQSSWRGRSRGERGTGIRRGERGRGRGRRGSFRGSYGNNTYQATGSRANQNESSYRSYENQQEYNTNKSQWGSEQDIQPQNSDHLSRGKTSYGANNYSNERYDTTSRGDGGQVSQLGQQLEGTKLSSNVEGYNGSEYSASATNSGTAGQKSEFLPDKSNPGSLDNSNQTKTSGKMRVDAPDFSPSNLSYSSHTPVVPLPSTYNNSQPPSYSYQKSKVAWVPVPITQAMGPGYGMSYPSMAMNSPEMYYAPVSAPQNASVAAPMAPIRNDFSIPANPAMGYNNPNYLVNYSNPQDHYGNPRRQAKPRRYSEMSFEK